VRVISAIRAVAAASLLLGLASCTSSHVGSVSTTVAISAAAQARTRSPVVPSASATLPTSIRLEGTLPWPLVARMTSGRFLIRPDASVVPLPRATPATNMQTTRPSGWVMVDRRTGAWAEIRDGRILIHRGDSIRWRSRHLYAVTAAADMNAIVLGRSGVALETRPWGPLYVAARRGRERWIAPHEFPEMWTRSGNLLTLSKDPATGRFSYRIRSPNGVLVANLASDLNIRVIDASSEGQGAGTFLFWDSGGDLMQTDGSRTRFLANYHVLGLSTQPSAYGLGGGLVELLTDDWHEVIVRTDGQTFATASGPTGGSVAGFGAQTASSDGTTVAYVLSRPHAAAVVYLLRQGSTNGVPIYRTPGTAACELPLSWHDRWVLFTPRDARSALIDTMGSSAPIVLPAQLSRGNAELRMLGWASSE
jgi:hypothetical protein